MKNNERSSGLGFLKAAVLGFVFGMCLWFAPLARDSSLPSLFLWGIEGSIFAAVFFLLGSVVRRYWLKGMISGLAVATLSLSLTVYSVHDALGTLEPDHTMPIDNWVYVWAQASAFAIWYVIVGVLIGIVQAWIVRKGG